MGLATFMGAAEYTYRYMYERMMERSEGKLRIICLPVESRTDVVLAIVLDNSIDEAGEILKEYYRIEELGDPSIQTQVCVSLRYHHFQLTDCILPHRQI